MTGREIDLATWPGREAFRLFRSYDRPHYAVTARVDVSALMRRHDRLPVFRTCLWVIGQALHAVPELRLRFRADVVTEYDLLDLSPTIATPDGFAIPTCRGTPTAPRSTPVPQPASPPCGRARP